MSDREYIKISLQLAKTIIQQGNQLFNDGAGVTDLLDDDGSPQGVEELNGVIDQLPLDSDVWYWANTLLGFARYVARMLQNEIDSDNILRIADSLSEEEI